LHERYGDELDEKGRRCCEQILKASLHLGALIEKINAYIEAKEATLVVEEIDVNEILQTIRDEFSPRLTTRQVEWVQSESMPEIKADKLSMIRAFRNFVDNSLKYGGEELREIRIAHRESDKFHIFSVSDNGAGIRGDDYEKLFAPFHRNAATKGVEGAGLGLAIVSEVAEQHRGRVWAEPCQNKGTTFYISISKDP
jgi:light-regulated signal transduction histidine kinase (bacteriophytochrome)